jgi:superfamily II DNA/RNA helicase
MNISTISKPINKSIETSATSNKIFSNATNVANDDDDWLTPIEKKNDKKSPKTSATSNKIFSNATNVANNDDDWLEDLKQVQEKDDLENIETSLSTTDSDILFVNSFEGMDLKEDILRGIFTMGFERPSEVQRIIKSILYPHKRDYAIKAKTGSGKTLTYGIVALEVVDKTIKELQSIIIVPTRELALQVYEVICSVAKYTGISIAMHRGTGQKTKNVDFKPIHSDQFSEKYCKFGTARDGKEQVIITTPSRLLDLLTNNDGINVSNNNKKNMIPKLCTDYVSFLAIDEADKLFSSQYREVETMYNIFDYITTFEYIQKLFVSTTLGDETLEICKDVLVNPIRFILEDEEISIKSIHQR